MYKQIFLVAAFFVVLVACNNKQNTEAAAPAANKEQAATAPSADKVPTQAAPANATWADDFRTMRDAIFNKQKEVVANYFNFPITDKSEMLWTLCSTEGSPTSGPFTKEDFMKNFDKIFTPEFVATLQKVKSEDLYKNGSSKTPVIKGKDVESFMNASFEKQNNQLILELNQNFYVEDGTGGESSTFLKFAVKDNKLKFTEVLIAG